MRKFSVHYCLLDKECRECGAPPWLYLHTRWGSLVLPVPFLWRQRIFPRYEDLDERFWGDLPKEWVWHKPFLVKPYCTTCKVQGWRHKCA